MPASPPGAEPNHQHQQPAEHQQAIVVHETDRLRQQRQADGGHHHTPGRSDAADHDHRHQHHRKDEVESIGGDELREERVETTGKTGERRAYTEGSKLVGART